MFDTPIEVRPGGFYKNRIGDLIGYLEDTDVDGEIRLANIPLGRNYDYNGRVLKDQTTPFDLVEEISEDEYCNYIANLQYPHIPVDAVFANFIRQEILHPHIGPHDFRILNLMKSGEKPLALISEKLLPKQQWSKELSSYQCFLIPARSKQWIVAQKDQLENALHLRKVIQDSPVNKTVEIGRLLGYRNEDVGLFLKRSKLLEDFVPEYRKTADIDW